MEKYYLQFEPLSKMFYVADSLISRFIEDQVIPQLELADADYERLGVPVPNEDAPIIGFLLGRSGCCYSIDWNYALALARTGVRLRFLSYHHCSLQLQKCQGLVLPGGAFESSEQFYTDPRDDEKYASLRGMAYDVCIHVALDEKLPILGICAGAQMVAGAFGLKLYRDFSYIETPIDHYVQKPEAHRLNVFPDTPLARIFGDDNLFFVNSRHHELAVPVKVQRELWAEKHHCAPENVILPLDFYAEANDGTPEAWGDVHKRILCVQWHPEDMAAQGDTKMQGIFQWFADQVVEARL